MYDIQIIFLIRILKAEIKACDISLEDFLFCNKKLRNKAQKAESVSVLLWRLMMTTVVMSISYSTAEVP